MQIHELPSGQPNTSDLIPFDTGTVNYQAPFSSFDLGNSTVTFTSDDEADPSVYKTVSWVGTSTLKSLLNKITTVISNVRYIWKVIGQVAMGTSADTVTGAIKEITDKIGTRDMGTNATTITGAIQEIRQARGADYWGIQSVENITLVSGTAGVVANMFLAPGLYIAIARVRFPASSTGSRRVNITTAKAPDAGSGAYHVSAASAGQEDTVVEVVKVLTPTENTRYYLNAWQNSGSTLTVSDNGWEMVAVRLV